MITVNLYYTGSNGSARAFAEEMEKSGIAADIRKEPGNLRYQYFQPLDDPETDRPGSHRCASRLPDDDPSGRAAGKI